MVALPLTKEVPGEEVAIEEAPIEVAAVEEV